MRELAQIPAGLALIFFGYALVRGAVALALGAQLAALAAPAGVAAAVAAAACGGGAAFGMPQDSPAFGGLLGAAVGLSFGGGQGEGEWWVVGLRVVAVAAVFALFFALVPEEIVIYVTAYGGSYMLWQGLAVLDGDVWEGVNAMPAEVEVGSVDMWFNILSFLLVGLIGVCTQIILLRNQMYAESESAYENAYEYVEIP